MPWCQCQEGGRLCQREIEEGAVACPRHWRMATPGQRRGFQKRRAQALAAAEVRRLRGERDPLSHYRREMERWRAEWAEKLAAQPAEGVGG